MFVFCFLFFVTQNLSKTGRFLVMLLLNARISINL